MLFLIDAGNTNVVFAVHDGKEIVHSWRIKTDAGRSRDEYASWLIPLFGQAGLSFGDITGVIASSVVPEANWHLRGLCEKYFGLSAQFVLEDIKNPGIEIDLETPSEAGADRVVNACAVSALYRYPAIVIDFGTATTFDVVDAGGRYAGGAIAPGVNLSVEALRRAAAKLPNIGIQKPPRAIGKRTVAAMQSGIYWGYIGLIEGIVGRIAEELGQKPFVIATGGLAPLFAADTPVIEAVDEDLTLKGLVLIASRVKHKKGRKINELRL